MKISIKRFIFVGVFCSRLLNLCEREDDCMLKWCACLILHFKKKKHLQNFTSQQIWIILKEKIIIMLITPQNTLCLWPVMPISLALRHNCTDKKIKL